MHQRFRRVQFPDCLFCRISVAFWLRERQSHNQIDVGSKRFEVPSVWTNTEVGWLKPHSQGHPRGYYPEVHLQWCRHWSCSFLQSALARIPSIRKTWPSEVVAQDTLAPCADESHTLPYQQGTSLHLVLSSRGLIAHAFPKEKERSENTTFTETVGTLPCRSVCRNSQYSTCHRLFVHCVHAAIDWIPFSVVAEI